MDGRLTSLLISATSGFVALGPADAQWGHQSHWEHRAGTTSGSQRMDLPPAAAKGTPMSDHPTHRELDAKLEAVEARAQTHFAELRNDIKNLTSAITGEHGVVAQMRDIKADNKNTRVTIAITVIGATLAALAALWTTQGSLLSAMQANLAAHPVFVSTPPDRLHPPS